MRHKCYSVLWGFFAVLAILPLNGCESDNPVAETTRPQPLRKSSWSAERQIIAYAIPNECPDGGCGEVQKVLPMDLGPGTHLVRVRISGILTFEGLDCRNLQDAHLGPMGIPWFYLPQEEYHTWNNIGYSLLFSRVWWVNGATSSTELDMQPVTTDSSVIEGEAEVYGSGRGIYLSRSLGINWFYSCHTVGDVQLQVFVRDQVVQQEAKLGLSCTPSAVTRGGSVACTINPSPSGATVSDVAWVYVDSVGHQITGPPGLSQWGGRIVVPGLVKITGKVNGTQAADSVLITVTPRKWPRISVAVHQGGHGPLPPVPALTNVGQLMQTRFDSIAPSALPLGTITDGPNAGWAYLSQPVRTLPLVVDVSDAWKHGSTWYNLQHAGPTGQVDTNGNPTHYCAKHELPQVYQAGLEHEGIKTGTIVSHVQVFRQWFGNNPAQDAVEKAAVFIPDLGGYDPARSIINGEVARVEDAAVADPNQRHTDVVPPGQVQLALFPCKVRF